MNSTTQWSILWNAALLPPQEMLPPDSLFCTLAHDTTTATNSEHLFGFTPCVAPLSKENNVITSHEHELTETQSMNNLYDTYEDCSALAAIEEFASFI